MTQKIGIIGAGQMGHGIAQICAQKGLDVLLNDITAEQAKAGLAVIRKNLDRLEKKDRLSQKDRKAILGRIALADTLQDLSNCDMVIEAATENEKIKISIFEELCKSLKPESLIASNTSSISITRLAASTDRPEQFMGVHFMNPVPVMKLVELICGIATSDETFEKFHKFANGLDKKVSVS